MKVNLKSISSKLMLIGISAALIPLCVVGYISFTKARDALVTLSMNQARDVAVDLSRLTRTILESEVHKAAAMAAQPDVLRVATAVEENGLSGSGEMIAATAQALKKQFAKMGDYYQGIFIADAKGQIYTGILENGSVYQGVDIANNPTFLRLKRTGRPDIDEVIRSAATKKLITTAAAPITSEDGRFMGIFGIVIKAEYFTELISQRTIGRTGYAYMINKGGLPIAHPNADIILNPAVADIPEMKHINSRMIGGDTGVEEYTFRGADKIAGFAPVGVNGWSIAVTQNRQEFLVASNAIRSAIVLVGLFAVVATTVLVLVSARTITRPINAAVAGLKDIAQGEGDLTLRLRVDSRDEVGDLARWFNTFIEKLQGIIQQIAHGVETLSASSTELSAISEQMSQAAQNTSEKSNVVATASEEMSTNMANVAAAMEQSATNTQAVATAAEQMSATVNEIAKNSERARSISDTAARKSAETSGRMDHLGNAAQAIGHVVEAITDISEQVNLLALNATIEAARAGEAGKGFAVVANEIKELAKQTAEATQDIKEKIGTIQDTTSLTVKDIEEITRIIQEVNDVVSGIATAVEEQSTATSEIAGNVSQAARGIQEVNTNVSQSSSVAGEISRDIVEVSATANEMSSSSSQVNMSAEDLAKLAEQLKLMVGQFKI